MAAPALADFTAEGVRQLGGKTGGKTHQQHRSGLGGEELGCQGQHGPGGRRTPDVFRAPPATPSFRQTPGLLAAKAQLCDHRAQGQIGHHGQPAPGPQAAPKESAQDTGVHPARLGQQGQSLGQGDQQPIDQEG